MNLSHHASSEFGLDVGLGLLMHLSLGLLMHLSLGLLGSHQDGDL